VEEQYRARNTDHATSLCRTLAGAEWRASFPLRRQSQANSVSFL
jgi:hypothetical protein